MSDEVAAVHATCCAAFVKQAVADEVHPSEVW
jgi:hypothetical protein